MGEFCRSFHRGQHRCREYFPARNRMISGLADMILVMEAKEKSGSLITAAFALDQGKTIYALPGPVTSELSKGCNRIISDGAVPLLSPKYLLEQEDLKLLKNHTNSPSDRVKNEKVLESPEKLLYATVGLDFQRAWIHCRRKAG